MYFSVYLEEKEEPDHHFVKEGIIRQNTKNPVKKVSKKKKADTDLQSIEELATA
jgi:hypothetical protein